MSADISFIVQHRSNGGCHVLLLAGCYCLYLSSNLFTRRFDSRSGGLVIVCHCGGSFSGQIISSMFDFPCFLPWHSETMPQWVASQFMSSHFAVDVNAVSGASDACSISFGFSLPNSTVPPCVCLLVHLSLRDTKRWQEDSTHDNFTTQRNS